MKAVTLRIESFECLNVLDFQMKVTVNDYRNAVFTGFIPIEKEKSHLNMMLEDTCCPVSAIEVGGEEQIQSVGIRSGVAYLARNPDWLQKGMKKLFGKKYDEEIMLLREDGRNITGYPCIPRLLGTWMKPHTETVVSKSEGMRAVTTQSFLVCAYGGWIFPETSGFEYEDPETEGIRPGYWRYPDE